MSIRVKKIKRSRARKFTPRITLHLQDPKKMNLFIVIGTNGSYSKVLNTVTALRLLSVSHRKLPVVGTFTVPHKILVDFYDKHNG